MRGRGTSSLRGRKILSFLLATTLALSGCTQLTDIHDRSLIFGIGLDDGPQPGAITLSAQAMHPPEGGGSGGGGGGGAGAGGGGGSKGGEWKTLVASGKTLSGALGDLQAQSDRQVYLGQLGIIFIGSSLAHQGALHDIDALVRSPQVAENLPVAVVEGRADAFLQQGTQQQVAWRVRNFVTKPRTGLAVLPNPLWHVLAQSLDPAGATYAPAFATAPEAEGLRFVGTAVFLDGRLVDTLSLQETAAVSWLVKREGFGGVTLGSDGDEFHVALQQIRARWDLSDSTAPRLQIAATGDVTASPGSSLAGRPSGMRQLVAQEMTAEVLAVLRRLQGDGADILGIRERLRERGAVPPGSWPQNFAHLHFSVSVRVLLVPGKIR